MKKNGLSKSPSPRRQWNFERKINPQKQTDAQPKNITSIENGSLKTVTEASKPLERTTCAETSDTNKTQIENLSIRPTARLNATKENSNENLIKLPKKKIPNHSETYTKYLGYSKKNPYYGRLEQQPSKRNFSNYPCLNGLKLPTEKPKLRRNQKFDYSNRNDSSQVSQVLSDRNFRPRFKLGLHGTFQCNNMDLKSPLNSEDAMCNLLYKSTCTNDSSQIKQVMFGV